MLTTVIPCPNCHFTGPDRAKFGCHICAPEIFHTIEHADPMWDELMRMMVDLLGAQAALRAWHKWSEQIRSGRYQDDYWFMDHAEAIAKALKAGEG